MIAGAPLRLVGSSIAARIAFAVVLSMPVHWLQANNVSGAWVSPTSDNWPLIPIHAVLTSDGRVLTYGTDGTGRQTGYFIYDVWDPSAGLSSGHVTLNNMTLTDIFCSSQIVLPQSGSVLLTGGDNWTGSSTTNTGNSNSNIFDGSTLTRAGDMNRSRWYASSTALMTGEIYIQGGTGGMDHPELRQADGSFRLLTGIDSSGLSFQYPRNFVAPDGRVFGIDNGGAMYYMNPSGTGQKTDVGYLSPNGGPTSSAVMFRPGKIIQLGGYINNAVVVDITGPNPVVTDTDPMSSTRSWVNATVLPNGKVVATGGSAVTNELQGVNNAAEIWDPATGHWTVGASGSRARLYHSVALLLPDASVLVAGGGAPGPLDNLHAEIYYPPYLYRAGGGFATRPVIASAPASIDAGQGFSIDVGTSNVSRVTMVKTGSVTHSFNMDQRFLELLFSTSNGTVSVQPPANPADAPPGYYLLFVIDNNGVPSVGKVVRMNISPTVQLNYTPTIGGSGGAPYVIACDEVEAVVGVYGNSAGSYVNKVGIQCVRVDTNGHWIGDPVNRGSAGGSTGAAYTRTCPRDFAISGFRGRSGQYVDQLDFECKALTPSGKVTGTGQFLGAVGGTGGSPQGPYSCTTSNPAYAFTGRAGSWVEGYGILCRQTPITTPTDPGSGSSVWSDTIVPATTSAQDTGSVELGVRFRTNVNGYVTGVRFYKGALNTGTHSGSIWSSTGTRLSTATFTNETATGWQKVTFATPLPVTANTPYVASYFAPSGGYSYNRDYFATSGITSGSIYLYRNGEGGGNGLYAYGATSSFPTNSYQSSNYWVDVVFTTQLPSTDTTPPTVTSSLPDAGATGVSANTSVTATFSEALDSATVGANTFELRNAANALVPGTVTYNGSTLTASFIPASGLVPAATYTARLRGGTTDPRVKDIAGNALANDVTWTFTTAANSPPVVTNPGNQMSTVGTPVSLLVSATDPESDILSYSANGLPAGLSISTASGLITGTPTTSGTNAVTIDVSDGRTTTSVGLTWTVGVSDPLVLDPMPIQPPQLTGATVTYTATSRNGVNTQYRWYFDDGSETGWLSSPTVQHSFAQPTIYWVAVTARDDRGQEQTQTFSQLVHLPLTVQRPAVSGNVALGAVRLWVVNQDNDTVSVFDTASNQKLAEVTVGDAPRAVAIAPNGNAWVTNRRSATISVIDSTTLAVSSTIALPRASQPFGIVFAPNGGAAYVALEASGSVLRLDPNTGAELGAVAVGPTPRQLSMNASGTQLYVSRFITPPLPGENTATVVTEDQGVHYGGEVVVVDPAVLTNLSTIVLRHSDDMDFENSGSGVPNYLGPAVISPDGVSAWVPSKKDNVKRGTLRSGGNLNHQNTVRAISSRIDLATNTENFGFRVDHDNASLASAAAFDRYGVFLFVALETSREVAVVDAHNHVEFFRINVGRAPQGVAVSSDGYRLYVHNFMDRTVEVRDLTKLVDEGQWQAPLLATLQSVATERLNATVLAGKQFFYDARDTRLAREGYLSCATCHNDGGHDGRVWDMTGLGEGLRNTVALNGRAGMSHGFVHWTGNFDEIQDFEGQIRNLAGGTGLMSNSTFNAGTRSQPLGDPKAGQSAELDALTAYVASLGAFAESPYRATDGSLTADAVAGKAAFAARNCAECHGGAHFTNSAAGNLRDVGTIKQPGSGKRLGGTLTGIDVPTLRDVWATAPYLHDGSAATLGDAVLSHTGVSIGGAELAQLVAYLQQIDGSEPAPPPPANVSPVVNNPGSQTGTVGVAVNLQIVATDGDNDPLTYSAAGLPAGLSIGSSTGLITGTPTTAEATSVTVTADDGRGGQGGATFSWTVTAANVAPVVTNPGGQSGTVGVAVNLQIAATDGNNDPLTYSATGLPAGLSINPSTGLITSTPTTAETTSVTVTADDGRGGQGTATFNWTINPANASPVVTNPGNQSSRIGVALSLSIVATDANGDTLTYSATGLPAGLSINPTTGLIAGTPTTAQTASVIVTANDGHGGTGSATFTWTVFANSAPVVTNPGNKSGTVGLAVNLQIVATDANGDALTYGATGLPNGLSISSTTGLITGTPTTAQTRTVTVTANDGYGGSGSATFTWTISNDTQVPSAPSNVKANATTGQIRVTWTASTDNVGVVRYNVHRSSSGGTLGPQIGTSTTTSYTDTTTVAGTKYVYRVKAADAAGNLSQQSNPASATAK